MKEMSEIFKFDDIGVPIYRPVTGKYYLTKNNFQAREYTRPIEKIIITKGGKHIRTDLKSVKWKSALQRYIFAPNDDWTVDYYMQSNKVGTTIEILYKE